MMSHGQFCRRGVERTYVVTCASSGSLTGYVVSSFGSIDDTIFDTYNVTGALTNSATNVIQVRLQIAGGPPAQTAFREMYWVEDDTTYQAASATYSTNGTTASWSWPELTAFTGGGTETIILRP